MQELKNFLGKRAQRFLPLAALLLLSIVGYSQQKIIGTIIDDTGFGLPGVNVLVDGTSRGTATDIDGKFEIMASPNETLVISFIGYNEQRITVGTSSIIDVTLAENNAVLGEVVVTGYSVDSRRSTPGSVSTVKSEDLTIVPSGNVEQQLQGRVPGVTVITNGQPGTTSQVRVRGYGALGGNAPLYVVDGVPIGNIDFLAPDDIATTTVLKDATAASIYGARAAGGVIVYTTKNAKYGKSPLKVTYNGTFSVTDPGSGAPIMSPQDQATWTWNAIRNAATQNGVDPMFSHPQYGTGNTPVLPEYLLVGGISGVTGGVNIAEEAERYNTDFGAGPIYQVVRANAQGTDWYDAITRSAFLQRHNLGFSGSGEKSRYYVGMNVQEQEGVLLHQKLSRYALRLNSEFEVLPGLRIGQNMQLTYRSINQLLGDSGGAGSSDDENVLLDASRMSAIIPVYDEFGGYAGTAAQGFNNPRNPVATLDANKDDRSFSTALFGNLYAEFDPIENLTLRSSIGGNGGSFHFYGYNRRQYENSENNSAFGFNQGSGSFTSWVFTNTANYKIEAGKAKFNILVGQEALNTGKVRQISGSGINPFSENVDFVNLSNVSGQVLNGFHTNGVTFASYFGRLNVEYDDKYILSAVVRRDGSSRFGAENRYGVFPAFSAAWRISSEAFMADQTLFEDLKLRGGWGVMGNSNNVDPNNQFSLFGTSLGASSYDINGSNSTVAQGFYRTRVGNPFAKWERAVTANIGLDALMFDGKLDIGIELWSKNTEDLLFQQPVSVLTGPFASAPSVNVGKMRNTGLDFSIINKGKAGAVTYELVLNGGFLNNEIVELAEGIENLPNRSASYRGITPVLNQVGSPLSSFYGYQVDGLYQDQADVDNSPTQEGAAPGRFKFRDIDGMDADGNLTGVPDGVIDIADRTVLGSPIPDFTGGLTLKLGYKGFGLDIYTFASIGNDVYNVSKLFTDFYPLFPGAAISERVKDSWSFDNPSGEIPIFENVSNFSTNTQSNSFYVEDGSYFRVQNVTLSYSLPANIIDRWNLSKLKVFMGVNNLFTITGYSGLDPSVGGAADTNFGIDLGNVPLTRSVTLGLNVDF